MFHQDPPKARPDTLIALLAAAILLMAWTQEARAQPQIPAAEPAPSGLYEGYSPITMAPFGPLLPAQTRLLPRWLEVKTQGRLSTLTFKPEGAIVWRLEYGPHGLTRKITEVDGQLWTESAFTWSADGRLSAKRVSGPGAPTPLDYHYKTDSQGRVLERSRKTWIDKDNFGIDRSGLTLRFAHTVGGVSLDWLAPGHLVRRDVFDPQGRLLRTEFDQGGTLQLLYDRDARGALTRVRRVIPAEGGAPLTETATFQRPRKPPMREPVAALSYSIAERHEVLLLLGAPATSSRDGAGALRITRDDYAAGQCWLNDPSGMNYDAADLFSGASTACICGFCVDAALIIEAADVRGVDLHWTEGPWVRLDGAVDVTADHAVMTPEGPRPAGDLRPGDLVLDASGNPRRLRAAALLPADGQPRLGRNVRTRAGVFAAGDILFQSEAARPCPPDGPLP